MTPPGKPRAGKPRGHSRGPAKATRKPRASKKTRAPDVPPGFRSTRSAESDDAPRKPRSGKAAGGIRLQKHLSDLGVGSRRHVEQWISEGRIRVDGQLAELGQRVTESSRISVNGRPVTRRRLPARDTRVLAYNKTEGEICSRDDPGNRPTVFRHLPKLRGARWVAVGRLDINTRGLLLFTNNGDLANGLMHPRTELEREYLCRVFGDVDDAALATLRNGVLLDGEQVGFRQVQRQRGEGRNTWYRVVVTEGRYREVRRLWEAVGCRVSRLVRVRYGNVKLPRGLRPGDWKELTPAEVASLSRAVEPARSDTSAAGRKSAGPPARAEHKPGRRKSKRTRR